MIDDSLDDGLGRTIKVGLTGPDWLDDREAVQGLANAAIRSLDAQRTYGGSDSGGAQTSAQPEVSTHPDDIDAVAAGYPSSRRHTEAYKRAIRELLANRGAEAKATAAAIAAELNPKPKYTPKDWRDPQMHGDAEAETIRTRKEIMKTAKPRTFVTLEQGMLICSGSADSVLAIKAGDAKLPTLGKDFGYDPEREQWISEEDTES